VTRKIVFSFFFLSACLLLHAGDSIFPNEGGTPKFEIRAVWLTTIGGIDWPKSHRIESQKAELCKTLDQLKQAGVNTVLLQTRIRATTIFPSDMEPWDACLTGASGKAPGYDPLQYAIEECHKRGMQLHAWVVTIPVGKWDKAGCRQLRQKHPDMVVRIGEDGFMDPEKTATADYLAKYCRNIVERYDVDGIHLDYIRYPETWNKLPKAKGAKGRNTPVRPTSLNARRAYITAIVKAIYQGVKAAKPWVMVSCSPIGKHDDLLRYRSGGWNARTAVCQDAQQWLKDGIMDALFPMMYFRNNHFFPFAIDWQEHAYGRFVIPGLGIYFLDPHEGKWSLGDVTRQMHVSRQLGMGHCYFRSYFLTSNQKGIYDFAERFDAVPSLIPPMLWAEGSKPAPPDTLFINKGQLCWHDTISNTEARVYNVYASEDYPVNVDTAANLVATRLTSNRLCLPLDNRLNYAVTIQDRYGRESRPRQLLLNAGPRYTVSMIAKSDGRPVLLPAKPSTTDANYVIIETLHGKKMQLSPYVDNQPIDVRHLPDGIYQVRSIGRKGVTHRIGFFSVKKED